MEDLSSLWEENLEADFVNLVRQRYSQETFERNAKIMLGDNWKELGQEIIDGYAPEEKNFFVEYVNGSVEKAT
jgi:hypothetical protein